MGSSVEYSIMEFSGKRVLMSMHHLWNSGQLLAVEGCVLEGPQETQHWVLVVHAAVTCQVLVHSAQVSVPLQSALTWPYLWHLLHRSGSQISFCTRMVWSAMRSGYVVRMVFAASALAHVTLRLATF